MSTESDFGTGAPAPTREGTPSTPSPRQGADAAQPPQRSTRAPAEGADNGDLAASQYDRTAADLGRAPVERSARDPAEGRPDAAPQAGQRPRDDAQTGSVREDGRRDGGASNTGKAG